MLQLRLVDTFCITAWYGSRVDVLYVEGGTVDVADTSAVLFWPVSGRQRNASASFKVNGNFFFVFFGRFIVSIVNLKKNTDKRYLSWPFNVEKQCFVVPYRRYMRTDTSVEKYFYTERRGRLFYWSTVFGLRVFEGWVGVTLGPKARVGARAKLGQKKTKKTARTYPRIVSCDSNIIPGRNPTFYFSNSMLDWCGGSK